MRSRSLERPLDLLFEGSCSKGGHCIGNVSTQFRVTDEAAHGESASPIRDSTGEIVEGDIELPKVGEIET